ncbi:ATPase, V1 complex, subunit H [Coemansia reversa NRRL 1564]|uniref:V-type proton ATPase subunit H n=1 Tax=Coemansia reversa (strain ATCC 12441 / NRRL 1564) TaxID=763665 RepID=A0A2G5B2Y9_COERN|nr:ATPase, V1 complex, subunit H [Coemansia reversa NRRL 1564]|eukprot:PIA13351.1 ATPase, V1 complex, subunit H [Coemansia reversa NRRL 1564]
MAVPDVPPAMVSNQVFDEFTDKVRVKPIPWEGYSRAGLITAEELKQLKDFQQQQQQQANVATGGNSDLSGYVPLLVNLTEKLSSIDALQYLLVVLDELVETDSSSAAVMANTLDTTTHAMFRCMEKKDDYLGLKACKILVGVVVAVKGRAADKFPFAKMFAYIERCLKSELTLVVDVALQVMQSALRVRRARGVLYNEAASCLAQIVDVLKRSQQSSSSLQQQQQQQQQPSQQGTSSPSPRATRGVVAVPQTQYEAIFCLWLLTFERTIAAMLNKKYDVIPVMVEIARSTVKEKVIRVIVGTWTNMLQQASAANVPNMLVAKVPACLATLSAGRNFKDVDLKEGVSQLAEDLAAHTGVLTTWDEYINELASGKLQWSAASHRSEQFWKLHVQKMDANDHWVVRQLAKILVSPNSSDVALAVACHDLSQYVKFNPDGKKLLAKIGAKTKVMGLMTSDFPEVRYEALMCVQQIMLNAWRN